VPIFADRGVSRSQRGGSRFSRPESLFFLSSISSIVLTRLSGPRSRPTTSHNFIRALLDVDTGRTAQGSRFIRALLDDDTGRIAQGSRFIRALLDDDTGRTAQGSRFKVHTCIIG
jgi:hypothetical protein